MDGSSTIVDGEHLTDEDIGNNVALIEKTLAEENDLKVGDTLTVTNPQDDSLSVDLTIKGIYETTSTGSDQAMNFIAMILYNIIYVPYTASSVLKGADYERTIDSAIKDSGTRNYPSKNKKATRWWSCRFSLLLKLKTRRS